MKITTTQYKRCDVVQMDGRIDSNTVPKLKEVFSTIIDSGRFKIVFDMSTVDFISSSGVWVLIDTQKTCKRWNRGELIIANVNDKIQHSLDLAGLKHFFKIYNDVTSAVGSF